MHKYIKLLRIYFYCAETIFDINLFMNYDIILNIQNTCICYFAFIKCIIIYLMRFDTFYLVDCINDNIFNH